MPKQNEKHFFGTVNQKALIRKNGQVLLQRFPDLDKNLKGKWDMPGGRLNAGESPEEGLKREVREEIGAEIEVYSVAATGVYTNFGGVTNFFIIYYAGLKNEKSAFVMQKEQVAEIKWVYEKDLFEMPIVFPEYKEALRKVLG